MAMTPGSEDRPREWKDVPADAFKTARERTLAALELPSAAVHLAWYYDREGNFAGSSFSQLGPNVRDDITATDLHATELLYVRIGPRSTRRLLEDGPHRTEVLVALRDPALDTELLVAGPRALDAMARLHEAVKLALSTPSATRSSPWVTAAKLCARKRPGLFPVRDTIVQKHLGMDRYQSYEIEYQVYRGLIGDTDIITALDRATSQARIVEQGRDLVITEPSLRVLDAALWTHAKYGTSTPRQEPPVPEADANEVR